ncbi:DUF2019 domain-containing protein [Methylocystis bryophila]|uniref:Uncharacterized protein n=1 Tax=Methylocystis bryophila TaxID=655015 RepID=A0A1W6MVF6_9HYPH|nr:DUF2019 domain-containing protein [Methylocystis bryophila]ARN81581.1 hypothetical protein B1812_11450 [Methylocystis bryophila]
MATNFGYQDEDKAMQLAGLRALDRAAKGLDLLFKEKGREALVPLLDDADLSVRVFAAGYLLKLMPDRALAVLGDIRLRGESEVRVTAGSLLRRFENGTLDM